MLLVKSKGKYISKNTEQDRDETQNIKHTQIIPKQAGKKKNFNQQKSTTTTKKNPRNNESDRKGEMFSTKHPQGKIHVTTKKCGPKVDLHFS